jgi:hypothetical protein
MDHRLMTERASPQWRDRDSAQSMLLFSQSRITKHPARPRHNPGKTTKTDKVNHKRDQEAA